MSKKKHPEHVNHERWLVSYADFITLLFAFFVVLFASSKSDKKKQLELEAAMKTAFTPTGIFENHAEKPTMTEGGGTATVSAAKPPVATKPTPKTTAEKLGSMVMELEKTKKLAVGSVTTHMTPEGLVISLREAGFFASGSADVQQSSLDALAQIAATLPQGPVRVEGHTDNIPIHTQQFATNWELSSARASTIARFLLDHGSIKPTELMAAGYAEFHPVADNATEDGRSKNRRVDIILLTHPVTSQ
jgi:chemotaxis protein MotB